MPTELTIDGFTILVGKNNKQNDYLTCRIAKSSDLWFHTKDIHGSHVVLKLNKINLRLILLFINVQLLQHIIAKPSCHKMCQSITLI